MALVLKVLEVVELRLYELELIPQLEYEEFQVSLQSLLLVVHSG